MRITRLSFAGFGPYRDEQSIDFRAFEDDGIYLIGGRTGAGKSTILDAVCFALYASVPRFEKGEARLRSDHSAPTDPTWVELEFTAGGRDYRVRRAPAFERPKSRGEGTTVSAPSAHLFVKEGDEWQGIAARPKDVGVELAEIVQLTRDQFLQVILLAQNRFQRFLAAGHNERQDLLRSLFATERFSSFEEYLVERRKAVEGELGNELDAVGRLAERVRSLVTSLPVEPGATTIGADGTVNTGHSAGGGGPANDGGLGNDRSDEGDPDGVGRAEPDDGELGRNTGATENPTSPENAENTEITDETWFAEAERSAVPARERAQRHVEDADAALAQADDADRRAQELAARVRRRDAALTARELLDARASADDAERRERDHARAAAPLWPLVAAMDTAIERERRALETRDDASAAYAAVAGTNGADPAGAVDTLTRELGSLTESLDEERSLPTLETDAQTARERLESARRAVETAEKALASLPSELESARAAVAAARVSADALDAATTTVEGLKLQVAASHDVRSSDGDVRRARAAELAAATAVTDASTRFEHLLRLRVAGAAGELAEDLVDGRPCAVCGSTTHPAPADPAPERVRDDDLDAARTARDEAIAHAERAARSLRDAETRRTLALVASGGVDVDELEDRLSAAETQRDTCASASARLSSLEQTVEDIVERSARADTDLADRTAERDAASEISIAAATRLEAAADRVSAARGEDASVADRVRRVTAIRDAAVAMVAATAALAERSRERADATAALEEALTASSNDGDGFPDADAVRAARLTDRELRELDARVSAAAEERAANTAVLADPDLADLPPTVPDTTETAAALLEARAERDEALARLHSARETERELREVRLEALSALSAVEARRDEVEAIRGLADTVEGKAPNTRRMDLETFVLAAQLEQIIAAANRRFAVMTSGRFALEHDDAVAYRNTASGLGLSIRDEYTGRSRPTASLSGGETFLAALALALGLAEVVTERAGGITLETLFIDEGFGSLDAETLEIAMSTLDELRAGGRTVGLISHVDAMKERIAARLTVEVDETGASHVRQQPVPLISGTR